MKDKLRQLCNPILKIFETDEPAVNYNPSHRTILLGVSILFFVLTIVAAWFAYYVGSLGALIPIIVFLGVSLTLLIVATLGSDNAVAKIWGNR
ncbi:hypothetical protein ABMA57_16330 [Saccharospirillum sp. HFRX-1]|uniref:hypothetical protein n=1 Tax=unclassified Saccharospirillum TaxID=2633430 RepID=UPI0037161339